MAPRLTADFWVRAYLARLEARAIPAHLVARGDATAGAVIVKLAKMDGTARAFQRSFDPGTGARRWMELAAGPEPEVDAALSRQRARDPDLWIVEVEDARGRTLLEEEGLDE